MHVMLTGGGILSVGLPFTPPSSAEVGAGPAADGARPKAEKLDEVVRYKSLRDQYKVAVARADAARADLAKLDAERRRAELEAPAGLAKLLQGMAAKVSTATAAERDARADADTLRGLVRSAWKAADGTVRGLGSVAAGDAHRAADAAIRDGIAAIAAAAPAGTVDRIARAILTQQNLDAHVVAGRLAREVVGPAPTK